MYYLKEKRWKNHNDCRQLNSSWSNEHRRNCAGLHPYDQHILQQIKSKHYLDSGERFNDPDEVLLQQAVIEFGQMSANYGVIPQFCFVLC